MQGLVPRHPIDGDENLLWRCLQSAADDLLLQQVLELSLREAKGEDTDPSETSAGARTSGSTHDDMDEDEMLKAAIEASLKESSSSVPAAEEKQPISRATDGPSNPQPLI
jgi:hypothetical protein